MPRTHNLLSLLGAAIALSACTKEIQLDLKDTSNKVVIEAVVTEGQGPHTVKITRSIGFDQPNDFPGIANAVVTLADDAGNTEQLAEATAGHYRSTAISGAQGHTCRLSVVVNGNTYTAQCTMPMAVPLVAVRVDSVPSFGSYTKVIVPVYTDPAGAANYYRLMVKVNGEQQPGVVVRNDRMTDGRTVAEPLFLDDGELKSGDTVELTLLSISQDVYDYFFTMAQNVGNGATPADPVSNIDGGALGYFSVHTASARSAVVP